MSGILTADRRHRFIGGYVLLTLGCGIMAPFLLTFFFGELEILFFAT
jgi:hypothetical protein